LSKRKKGEERGERREGEGEGRERGRGEREREREREHKKSYGKMFYI
jgi:hypothetical protein